MLNKAQSAQTVNGPEIPSMIGPLRCASTLVV